MKYSIHDYTRSMSNIMPSESFISETEALMKKVRDSQAAENTLSETHEAAPKITVTSKNGNKKKFGYAAAVLSTAAAAVICVTAVKLSSANKPEDSMAADTAPAVTEAAAAETELPAEEAFVPTEAETSAPVLIEDKAPSESTAAVENDTSENPPADTAIEAAEETVPNESVNTDDTYEVRSLEEEETSVEQGSGNEDISSENTERSDVSEEENTLYDETVSTDNGEDDDAPMVQSISSYDYSDESVSEDGSAGADDDFGSTPLYVPEFDDFGFVEETEDAVDEEADYDISPSVYTIAAYDHSFSSADEVYVPDSISGLEAGCFDLTISAGFDSYDEKTGMVSSGAEAEISADDSEALAQILYAVETAVNSGSAVYSDSEAFLSDYRYKISVFSAVEGENGALLFEISYNDSTLIINRYDNGTVSSEKYGLSSGKYKQTDSIISAKFK